MANYRNRKLLDLAHGINECQCGCGLYLPDGCEPAHSNLPEHGKGMGQKSHDVFFAALAHSRHAELDQGSKMTRDERYSKWRQAADRTLLTLWQTGKLRVA